MNKSPAHSCEDSPNVTYIEDIYNLIATRNGLDKKDFYLTCNGRLPQTSDYLVQHTNIQVHLRVLGGKGGFGSMLRAIGARIEKTTNHEACRDLSGRRMRDVNNEKKIADWLKAREEKEEEQSRKREEKLEKILNPKFTYEDNGYTLNLHKNADSVDEALKEALKNRKIGDKRKVDGDNTKAVKKKSKMAWMGFDDDVSDDDDDQKVDQDQNDTKPSSSDENNGSKVETKCQTNDDQPIDEQADAGIGKISKMPCTEEKIKVDSAITTLNHQSAVVQVEAVDLSEYTSAEQLEAVGLDRLKSALIYLGLKCGGTLQERAQRLYLTKHTPIDQLDSSLFSKTKRKKK